MSRQRDAAMPGSISRRASAQASERCLRGLFAFAALGLLAACDDAPTEVESDPPEIMSVSRPIVGATMMRSLIVELDRPGRVTVDYGEPGGATLRVDSPLSTTSHEIDLIRMRSDREYQISVTASGPGGRSAPTELVARTDTLPSHLSGLRFETTGAPTWPLMMLEITVPTLAGSPIIIDDEGEIVWFREESSEAIHGVGQLPGVGFAVNTQDGLSIVRPDGSTMARLTEEAAAARSGLGAFEIHHDVIGFGGSEVLFLVEDTATVAGAVWTGEALWSWDYSADELSKRWTAFDAWSPTDHAGSRSWTGDWLHGNSLSIGPRGNIVVSFFWTHEVVSIAPDFGFVEWALGGPATSFVVEGGAMDAGQHTASEIAPNQVLVFDNGLDRPGGELYSRAIELALDQDAGTAEVTWEFRPDPDIYAPIVSAARRLSNGNTVVAFGTSTDFGGLPSTGPVTVYEVTSDGDVVSQLSVEGAGLMYRATPLLFVGTEFPVSLR